MKRCPKHPDRFQTGRTCETWATETRMCGETLVPVPQEEIDAMRADRLRESLEKTTLPPWVVDGIRQLAWDQGHSCGQAEVDNYILEWLGVFEGLQEKGT